jgi:hypothetical protein
MGCGQGTGQVTGKQQSRNREDRTQWALDKGWDKWQENSRAGIESTGGNRGQEEGTGNMDKEIQEDGTGNRERRQGRGDRAQRKNARKEGKGTEIIIQGRRERE